MTERRVAMAWTWEHVGESQTYDDALALVPESAVRMNERVRRIGERRAVLGTLR